MNAYVCVRQNGYAPLHLTSPLGNTRIATLLLNNGANANCRAKNGLTPMHLCAQEDKVAVAEILEKHGAEIDPQTKVSSEHSKIELFSLLFAHSRKCFVCCR